MTIGSRCCTNGAFAVPLFHGLADLLQTRMLVLHRGLRVGMPEHLHERGQIPSPLKNVRRECGPSAVKLHCRIKDRLLSCFAPQFATVVMVEAAVYASMGRQVEAENTYRKAAALRPQHWDGYYELGVFYYRQQRYADAGEAFERVLEITPDNALAHATLGGMMQLMGKNAEAEEHLRRSIELQPSYTAYNNLGALYYRERCWEESAAMTRKALEINANDWRAWSNLRLTYEWLNDKPEAEVALRNELARLEEIAKLSSDDADIQVELGLLYSKLQLRKKSLLRIEAALALSPEDPGVLVCAGEAYDNLGDRTRALELVKQGLAKGWVLADLQNDPGQQSLLRDPRFREIARQSKDNTSPAQQ